MGATQPNGYNRPSSAAFIGSVSTARQQNTKSPRCCGSVELCAEDALAMISLGAKSRTDACLSGTRHGAENGLRIVAIHSCRVVPPCRHPGILSVLLLLLAHSYPARDR